MSIARGILRLALFQADGFEAFAPTSQALLNSFAPLLALPLVGGMLQLVQGEVVAALSDLLATVVALLTPLVISEAFARRWGRQMRWARFAVASNWCQWALPMLLLALALFAAVLAQAGIAIDQHIAGAGVLVLVLYGVALHWFLARRGLDISRGRATLLVLLADLATGTLVVGPRLLAIAMAG